MIFLPVDSSNTAELHEGVTTCKEREYTSGIILSTLCLMECFFFNFGLQFILYFGGEMGT